MLAFIVNIVYTRQYKKGHIKMKINIKERRTINIRETRTIDFKTIKTINLMAVRGLNLVSSDVKVKFI